MPPLSLTSILGAAAFVYGGYQSKTNYDALKVDMAARDTAQNLVKLDPTGVAAQTPAVQQQIAVYNARVSQDETALVSSGLIALAGAALIAYGFSRGPGV